MNLSTTASFISQQNSRPSLRAVWFPAFILALVLYVLTACRDIEWQDSGQQQLRIITADWHHPRGLAIVHPVHHFLGRFAVRVMPWLEPAHAITLVSAPPAAMAVANVACTVLLVSSRRFAALFAAVALGLSHTFWQHGTHTESYSLMAALLSGEWLCLAIWTTRGSKAAILLLALFNGLGVANHLIAALATPIDALVIILMMRERRISTRDALTAAVLWLLGTVPYGILILLTLIQTGDFAGTINSALFGDFQSKVLNLHVNSRSLVRCAGYAIYNFPGLTIPLAAYGLIARAALPKLMRLALLAEGLILTAFAARYPIPDQYTYFLPVYVLITLLAGVGLAAGLSFLSSAAGKCLATAALATAAWTPLVYSEAYSFFSTRETFSSLIGKKPYSDGYREAFLPWGNGQDRGRRLNAETARLAAPNGIILVADSMPWYGLQYAKAMGRLPAQSELVYFPDDLPDQPVDEWRSRLRAWLRENRPVILIPRNRDRPYTCVPDAQWESRGDLYVLTGLR